jgi:hypothetical protein
MSRSSILPHLLCAAVIVLAGPARAGDAGVVGEVADDVAVDVDAGAAPAAPAPPVDAGVGLPPTPSPAPPAAVAPPASAAALSAKSSAFPVVVEDLPTPITFSVPMQGRSPRSRAADASAAFAAALTAEAPPGARPAQVVLRDAVAIVKVQGRAVATLTAADAEAAGATSLAAWSEELETRLVDYVTTWQRRHSLQALAFHIFFSVTLIVLAVLTLRGLNRAMARADAAIEDRAAAIKPLVLFDVPLLSSDAARGLLATGLLLGRVVGVVVVVVAAAGGVLAQFDATRPLLASLMTTVAQPIVGGLGAFVAAVPGLVLAVFLVIAWRGGLRFIRLLLDGVAAGRVSSAVVKPRRAGVTRIVSSVVVTVVALPLIVGAAFGRFGTPIETLTLVVGGVVGAAALPFLASAAVGIVVAWRSTIAPGDWLAVDGVVGEVAAIHLTELVLVPVEGGTVSVPMLLLLGRTLRRLPRQPEHEQIVRLERRERARTTIDTLAGIARAVDVDGGAELVRLERDALVVRVFVPLGKSDARGALGRALLDAVDDGVITLAAGGPEPR